MLNDVFSVGTRFIICVEKCEELDDHFNKRLRMGIHLNQQW